ncbi:MAG: RNA polymerase factor sigma-54 [Terriglobales bacterium]|jgi:RNA polymerase sigma-54 factor|nr:RNA polymerase factor sigma-54 [Terriglobales bacterium]
MVMLQPKLHLKVSQRQILTPGLVQMVSVLALNKLELRDMITAEMVENPVLEELEESVPLIDEVGQREEERDRPAPEENTVTAIEKKDPFEEIDFGSFFQEYLDPGYRSPGEMEEIERPSFENFLSKPSNLSDHLKWQLGSIPVSSEVREAAEVVIGNLSEDGYLIASDDEMLGIVPAAAPEADAALVEKVVKEAAALGLDAALEDVSAEEDSFDSVPFRSETIPNWTSETGDSLIQISPAPAVVLAVPETVPIPTPAAKSNGHVAPAFHPNFNLAELHEAIELVRQMDPPGVACRDLRECLLQQLRYHQLQFAANKNGNGEATDVLFADTIAVVDQHLRALQNKQYKEIARALSRPIEAVQASLEFIRTLDPRPGLRYNKVQPRLIEPDVAFVKHGDEWLVIMNDDDVPQLRLNPAYKRLMTRDTNDKDTRNYVKERYKSAMQLIKNIEQRKQTIAKVCYTIVARQGDFLELGIDQLKPMMIKEVAEEIGVHPSTVSRAVANKYAHTPQGVFELRYFFSESVNGPEGGNTSLLILKRRVKKLIEEEDSARPLTDEQLTRILQSQGIQVTRRTVAKYREDMRIPSTHQRRVKK